MNRGGGVIGVMVGGLVSAYGWWGDWGPGVVRWLEPRGGEVVGTQG